MKEKLVNQMNARIFYLIKIIGAQTDVIKQLGETYVPTYMENERFYCAERHLNCKIDHSRYN